MLTMKVLLAALDMLLGVLQQHMNHRTDIKPILALERGVTEDEHSAALKLLEVNLRGCIYIRHAFFIMNERSHTRSPSYIEVHSLVQQQSALVTM